MILAKRKHEDIIGRFGEIIANHLGSLLQDGHEYVITPVPGDPERERFLFRGFDRTATEILADAICDGLVGKASVRAERLLVEVRAKAKRQHQCLSTAERVVNVRGLYALKRGAAVAGRGIVLVDDVITSGATMAECAGVLRTAGATEVLGVALARTVKLRDIEYDPASPRA